MAFEKVNILGSNISVENRQEVIDAMRSLVVRSEKTYICVSNVHTVVMGKQDSSYQAITNGAGLATADGMPLVWVSKFLGRAIHDRASGPDIMTDFFQQDVKGEYKHFLFGSTVEVLKNLETEIRNRWPQTKIVGVFSPPFAPPSAELDGAHAQIINESGAQIVWVGLGAPKQEQWMARLRGQLNANVLIGVGAAFDFISGNKPRAPIWMQKCGLEWLHRLCSEPRRLFSRYFVTNTYFLWNVGLQIARQSYLGRPK